MEISIVIPNYNGKDLLKKYLPSVVLACSNYRDGCEITVVDDGSFDGSVEFLKERFRNQVKLICHNKNLGFQKACFSGIKASRNRVVILLNSDVAVDKDFIEPLLPYFSQDDTFSVGPVVLDRHGLPDRSNLRIPFFKRGRIRYKRVDPKYFFKLKRPIYMFFGLGGAIAVEREKFLSLGGFDEIYEPFSREDVDLGFCAWRRGWKSYFEPSSKVYHIHPSSTIGKYYKKRYRQIIRIRNTFLFLTKHLTLKELTNSFFWITLNLISKMFKLDLNYHIAFFKYIKMLKKVLHSRNKEKRETVLSNEEIYRIFYENYGKFLR